MGVGDTFGAQDGPPGSLDLSTATAAGVEATQFVGRGRTAGSGDALYGSIWKDEVI